MRRLVLVAALAFLASAAWAGDADRRLKAELQARGVSCDLEGLVVALGSSESSETRAMAAQYLSMHPEPRAWERLARAAREDPDDLVRAQAINALLAIDCEKADSVAKAALEASEETDAKRALVFGLSRCGQPEALEFYLSTLDLSDDRLERYTAVVGCGGFVLGGFAETLTVAVDCLLRGMEDPDSFVRSTAESYVVLAVDTYGIEDSKLVEALVQLSSKATSEKQRQAAEDALRAYREKH